MSKKYRVELTALAQDQIVDIARYITDELMSPDAADRLVDKLETEAWGACLVLTSDGGWCKILS